MKKRIQKLTALLLFGSLTVSLLTGCGGGNSGSSGGDGSSSSEESSESSGGAGEVTLWHYFEH